MKIKFLAALAAASVLSVGSVVISQVPAVRVQANPCAAVNPCAGAKNPCATANPCASKNPCAAANPCAAKNPCAAANPCASKNPCAAANPCAAKNPCAAANPCASKNPCAAANPCAAKNPCAAANPCAAKNPCAAANPCAGKKYLQKRTYSDAKGAIRGADPVAYFSLKPGAAPVLGSDEYTYEWSDATWKFASQANLDKFAANPEKYAPQYGGYCAKAASDGVLASVVPTSWKIVEGKLYLNYSALAQQEWEEDVPGKIAKADALWPGLLNNDVVYE
ncbi:MAG: YHS domain-containing (seleno)protein [Cyanobacteria bacterium P01_H01_bin.15]